LLRLLHDFLTPHPSWELVVACEHVVWAAPGTVDALFLRLRFKGMKRRIAEGRAFLFSILFSASLFDNKQATFVFILFFAPVRHLCKDFGFLCLLLLLSPRKYQITASKNGETRPVESGPVMCNPTLWAKSGNSPTAIDPRRMP
jgi:hypothetical protein